MQLGTIEPYVVQGAIIYQCLCVQTGVFLCAQMPILQCCRVGTSITSQAGRAGLPAFDGVLEVLGHGKCRFHPDASASIDSLLADRSPDAQLRTQKHGKLIVRYEPGSAVYEVGNSTEAEWLRSLATGAAMTSKP